MKTSRGSRDIPSLLEGLAATPDRLEAVTRGAGDDTLDDAPDGEWSARTVLAHLRDDEFMVMRLRLARMIVEEHPRSRRSMRGRGRSRDGAVATGFRSCCRIFGFNVGRR